MTIDLPPELERYVLAKVESGEFSSPADVVSAGLQALEDEDRSLQAEREFISNQIEESVVAVERGEVVDGETFFAELEREENDMRALLLRKSA